MLDKIRGKINTFKLIADGLNKDSSAAVALAVFSGWLPRRKSVSRAGTTSRLFFARRDCLFCDLGHAEFNNRLGRDLYLLFCLWIYTDACFTQGFNEFPDSRKDKLPFLLGLI